MVEITLEKAEELAIPHVSSEEADRKRYVSGALLERMHLSPVGYPVAYNVSQDGTVTYYFDPAKVTETPPELWYQGEEKSSEKPQRRRETMTLESGAVVEKMGTKRAATFGYYTKERLDQLNYDVVVDPVAYSTRNDGTHIFFYDKKMAVRRPLKCVVCGQDVRYKRKMCRACFETDLAHRREEGDIYRAKPRHMDRKKVLFFDLELTGVYDHDEVLSITVINGLGETVMDTLVRPVKKRRWNRTEKIHGITPEMVKDAPTMADLTPRLVDIFAGAKHLIAFGTSTDYSHLRRIYKTRTEQGRLRAKLIDCAAEFSSYIHEHEIELVHRSLSDAMAHFSLAWEGEAHTSAADTQACRLVFHTLFPHFYESEAI